MEGPGTTGPGRQLHSTLLSLARWYFEDDHLTPVHARYRFDTSLSRLAAQTIRRFLAGTHGLLALPEVHADHLAALAINEPDEPLESVMSEIGMDISCQQSKTLDHYLGEPFDYVITVCDEANEACPFFPGGTSFS